MRVSRLTTGAALAIALLLAACASDGEPTPTNTLASATPPAATTAAPTSTPTSTPEPTATPVPLPPAQPTSLLWEAHGPVTRETSTAYLAINPLDGNIWVGIPYENRFWIVSPSGKYIESWGEAGKGPGQLDLIDHSLNPNGFTPIAFAPDGSFVVGDTGNNRVQLFDAHRQFVREWGSFGSDDGEFVQIVSIATDGTIVYVGDGDHYNIQAFDMDGSYLRTIGKAGSYNSVAVGLDGRILAANTANRAGHPPALAIFDPDGSIVSTTSLSVQSADAIQPVLDAEGNIYVNLEQNSYPWTPMGVVQFDPNGRVVQVFEGGGDFIAVSPDGQTLYAGHGIQLDTTQWTSIRAFSLAGA